MNLQRIDTSAPWFKALEACDGIEQGDIHHPEGDVLIHSLQVFGWACRESNDFELILAALLHDVGKAIDVKGHDNYGYEMMREHVPEKTAWLIKNHMRFWYFVLGDMKRLKKAQDLAGHPWLRELAVLARWDKMGRDPGKMVVYDREAIIRRLKEKRSKDKWLTFSPESLEDTLDMIIKKESPHLSKLMDEQAHMACKKRA